MFAADCVGCCCCCFRMHAVVLLKRCTFCMSWTFLLGGERFTFHPGIHCLSSTRADTAGQNWLVLQVSLTVHQSLYHLISSFVLPFLYLLHLSSLILHVSFFYCLSLCVCVSHNSFHSFIIELYINVFYIAVSQVPVTCTYKRTIATESPPFSSLSLTKYFFEKNNW